MKKGLMTLLMALVMIFGITTIVYADDFKYERRVDEDEYDEDDPRYRGRLFYDDDGTAWIRNGFGYIYPADLDNVDLINNNTASYNGEPLNGWAKYRMVGVDTGWGEVYYIEYIYSIPGTNGKLLTNTWIIDDGRVYYLNEYGVTTYNTSTYWCRTNNPEHPNTIYNVQTATYEPLPYRLDNATGSFAFPMGGYITYDNLIYNLSGQAVNDTMAKIQEDMANYESNKQSVDSETLYNMAYTYIPTVLASSGYGTSFTNPRRISINDGINGYYVLYMVNVGNREVTVTVCFSYNLLSGELEYNGASHAE